jgi:hypothetical protein
MFRLSPSTRLASVAPGQPVRLVDELRRQGQGGGRPGHRRRRLEEVTPGDPIEAEARGVDVVVGVGEVVGELVEGSHRPREIAVARLDLPPELAFVDLRGDVDVHPRLRPQDLHVAGDRVDVGLEGRRLAVARDQVDAAGQEHVEADLVLDEDDGDVLRQIPEHLVPLIPEVRRLLPGGVLVAGDLPSELGDLRQIDVHVGDRRLDLVVDVGPRLLEARRRAGERRAEALDGAQQLKPGGPLGRGGLPLADRRLEVVEGHPEAARRVLQREVEDPDRVPSSLGGAELRGRSEHPLLEEVVPDAAGPVDLDAASVGRRRRRRAQPHVPPGVALGVGVLDVLRRHAHRVAVRVHAFLADVEEAEERAHSAPRFSPTGSARGSPVAP